MRRFPDNLDRMRRISTRITLGVLLLASSVRSEGAHAQAAAAMPSHSFFHVSLDTKFKEPVAGRLLLFIAPPSGDGSSVDMNMMAPTSVYIAAKEIRSLAPGELVDVDAEDLVFPLPLSRATAGHYRVQAVLDVHHSYNYNGRAPGDLLSAPISIDLPLSASPSLTLVQVVPEPPDPLAQRQDVAAALKPLDFISPVLTRFWGREIHMQGWVLLPPGYDNHPYVQQVIERREPRDYERQVYSAGSNRPAGAKVSSPVAWMARGKVTELWESIDETIVRMGASRRAVTEVKAQVASKCLAPVAEPSGDGRRQHGWSQSD